MFAIYYDNYDLSDLPPLLDDNDADSDDENYNDDIYSFYINKDIYTLDINEDILPLPLLFDNNDNTTDHDVVPMYADAPLEPKQQEMSTIGTWYPHSRLSSTNVALMDPPRDKNCLFQACCSKVKNCSIQEVTTNDASYMRHDLIEFLLDHASNCVSDLIVW